LPKPHLTACRSLHKETPNAVSVPLRTDCQKSRRIALKSADSAHRIENRLKFAKIESNPRPASRRGRFAAIGFLLAGFERAVQGRLSLDCQNVQLQFEARAGL
jgi:hypothetical protein